MNIEFWYDPVLPETRVEINGIAVEAEDGYGFLYPVQNYVLQNWLQPTGSWSGLACQISDVARGEAVEIGFHGMTADFDDFRRTVEAPGVTVRCEALDTREEWNKRVKECAERMKTLGNRPGSIASQATHEQLEALTLVSRDEEWLIQIDSEEALRRAARDRGSCCVVMPDYLTSLSALESLEALTRSMRRCGDMICCIPGDVEALHIFSDYASQFPRMAYRFISKDQWEGQRTLLRAKYGQFWQLRRSIGRCLEAAASLAADASGLEMAQEQLKQLQGSLSHGSDVQQQHEEVRIKVVWMTQAKDLVEAIRRNLASYFDTKA